MLAAYRKIREGHPLLTCKPIRWLIVERRRFSPAFYLCFFTESRFCISSSGVMSGMGFSL